MSVDVSEGELMSGDTAQGPRVVAGLMELRLHDRDYWYALLYFDPPGDEDPAYRRGAASPLYVEKDALVSDLGMDGIPIGEDLDGEVDVDLARAVIGYEMSRDEIDTVITAWNALDDLTSALGVPLGFHGRRANHVYDKLFWGLNLESVTPPGEWYVPSWQRKSWPRSTKYSESAGPGWRPAARTPERCPGG